MSAAYTVFICLTAPTNPPVLNPDYIDKSTHEIKQDEDKVVYKSLEEVGDDLPDHAPRFVLLSYPLTLVRKTAP